MFYAFPHRLYYIHLVKTVKMNSLPHYHCLTLSVPVWGHKIEIGTEFTSLHWCHKHAMNVTIAPQTVQKWSLLHPSTLGMTSCATFHAHWDRCLDALESTRASIHWSCKVCVAYWTINCDKLHIRRECFWKHFSCMLVTYRNPHKTNPTLLHTFLCTTSVFV